ncbi:MAG: transketolase C-terminal domain-containing protein, partial [Actinomycetota bacterium]
NVWEAIADPATQGLANVTLVVDLNRQSLDRVVPDIQAHRLQSFFADAGWHVVEAKYGHKLQAAFEQPGGDALRERIDEMPNEAYQSLFAMKPKKMRKKFLKGGSLALQEWAATVDDDTLAELVFNLGGHDLGLLVERFRECDAVTDRPSVVFAYTIKGWSLPMAGDPLNHAALLTEEQIDDFRRELGLTLETEWDRFPTDSAAGRWCGDVGGEINNEPPKPRPILHVPAGVARFGDRASVSSQEAFGRILTGFADVPDVRPRLVTTSPDVSISTNLGGIINKLGVFSPDERDDHGGADRLLRWAPSPDGHHIELGISEMNLFLLLGQLGLAHEHHGEMLVPIGTVYDPFVLRGLDAFIYSLYNAGRFIVAGTPSGVTLAPEGGAHQSTITASVGMELPGVCFSEPAYATELDWILCDAVRQLHEPDGESAYVRLSTRPVDQSAFSAARDRIGVDELRRQVLAGGYRLREGDADLTDGVVIATSGAMVPEALAAADELEAEGVAATIIAISSADRLYRDWQRQVRSVVDDLAHVPGAGHLDSLIKTAERGRPVISVQDAASHSLAWLGSAIGARQIALGVDRFGESGRIADLHDIVGISAAHIVNAGVVAAEGL